VFAVGAAGVLTRQTLGPQAGKTIMELVSNTAAPAADGPCRRVVLGDINHGATMASSVAAAASIALENFATRGVEPRGSDLVNDAGSCIGLICAVELLLEPLTAAARSIKEEELIGALETAEALAAALNCLVHQEKPDDIESAAKLGPLLHQKVREASALAEAAEAAA
jgi:hypothetical protein